MARLSELTGIRHETIRTWFGGRTGQGRVSRPSLQHAVRVAQALDTSLDLLVTGKEYWQELQNPKVRQLCRRVSLLPPKDLETVEVIVDHLSAAIARADRAS